MPTTKTYPLTIAGCSGDIDVLWSRGHHDAKPFRSAAAQYFGAARLPKGFTEPEHAWWRSVPCRGHNVPSMYVEAQPHARGAFPVTYTERY